MEIETAEEKEENIKKELESEGIDIAAIGDKKNPSHIAALETLQSKVSSGKLLFRLIPILADGAKKEIELDAAQERSFQEAMKDNMAAYDQLIIKLPDLIVAVLSSEASIEEKKLVMENIRYFYQEAFSAQTERLEMARKPVPRWLKNTLVILSLVAIGGSAFAGQKKLKNSSGSEESL